MALGVEQPGDSVILEQPVSQSDLKEASKGIREDFIAIFGIFATLFIFLSIEIQILKQATKFSLLVGFSLFILGAMLSFLVALRRVSKEESKWSDYYKNPVVLFYSHMLRGCRVLLLMGQGTQSNALIIKVHTLICYFILYNKYSLLGRIEVSSLPWIYSAIRYLV